MTDLKKNLDDLKKKKNAYKDVFNIIDNNFTDDYLNTKTPLDINNNKEELKIMKIVANNNLQILELIIPILQRVVDNDRP
jgi:hypothetical protein